MDKDFSYNSLIPELKVEALARSLRFYLDVVGYRKVYELGQRPLRVSSAGWQSTYD